MNKQPLIGLREAFKKSFNLALENKNLGYYVKVILFTNVLFSLLAVVLMLPVFFIQSKVVVDRANSYTDTYNLMQQQRLLDLENAENAIPGDGIPNRMGNPYNVGSTLTTTSNVKSSGPFVAILMVVVAIFGILMAMVQYNISILVALDIYNSNLAGLKSMLKRALNESLGMLLLLIMYSIIITLGFILFIIPGIIFAVRFGFAPYILLDNNKGPLTAMKESWALVKGYTLSVYLKTLGFLAAMLLLMVVLSPVLAVGLYTGVAFIFTFIGQLIFVLFAITLYKDLKRIKETPVTAASAAPADLSGTPALETPQATI